MSTIHQLPPPSPSASTPSSPQRNNRTPYTREGIDAPQIATPEVELPLIYDRRLPNRVADEAVMGATGDLDNVGGFEVYDESGELVKGLFIKFLSEL
jgi:hypothetical protein